MHNSIHPSDTNVFHNNFAYPSISWSIKKEIPGWLALTSIAVIYSKLLYVQVEAAFLQSQPISHDYVLPNIDDSLLLKQEPADIHSQTPRGESQYIPLPHSFV